MKDFYKMDRLDFYLFQSGKVKSRQKAKELVLEGGISVNGKVVKKPSFLVSASDSITVSGGLRYVGRGGLKLEKAVACFGLDFSGKTALDVGASTGGFTDCMLQHGAAKVYALDVGHGQLDETLQKDRTVF